MRKSKRPIDDTDIMCLASYIATNNQRFFRYEVKLLVLVELSLGLKFFPCGCLKLLANLRSLYFERSLFIFCQPLELFLIFAIWLYVDSESEKVFKLFLHCSRYLHIIGTRDGGNASLGLVERPWSTETAWGSRAIFYAQVYIGGKARGREDFELLHRQVQMLTS